MINLLAYYFQEHDAWENCVEDGKSACWYEIRHIVLMTFANDQYETDIQEGVCAGDHSHEKLDNMPLVELQQFGILKLFLDAIDHPYLPNGTQCEIETEYPNEPQIKHLCAVIWSE